MGTTLLGDNMEVPDTVEFDVSEDSIEFTTKTNGDSIRMHGLHMTKETAGALAYMVNSGSILEIEIKVKGT